MPEPGREPPAHDRRPPVTGRQSCSTKQMRVISGFLVGRIAAGWPITAAETDEEVVPLPRWLVGQGDLIMLEVVGDSMIDAAITDGDRVVVPGDRPSRTAKSSPPWSKGGGRGLRRATVKTFRKRDGHVWLMPHNPAYEPIPGDNARIVGKVVAVLRRDDTTCSA